MSRLREQLQSAKQSHQALRYPGDLAADVLMPRMSIGRQLLIGASVAAGIAAVLMMIVWLGRQSPVNPQIARAPELQQAERQQETIPLAFTIDRPGEAISPPSMGASSIPAVWGFPTPQSIQEELASQTQSEEESS
jgi:hypothetical protein